MKRITAIAFCILTLTLSFTVCSKEPSIYVDKDDSPLTIYIPDNNEFIKHHIDKYNAAHDEAQIEYDVIAKEYLDVTYHKMKKEMEEGRGPDLIFTDRTFIQRNNIKELINDGMLADMNELIKRSTSYDADLYNMNVIDSGIINDTRAFIPISYTTDILVSSKQLLENNGLELTRDATIQEFIDMINTFNDTATEDNPAFFYYSFLNQVIISHIDVLDNRIEPTEKLYSLLDIINKTRKRASIWIKNLEEFDLYALVFERNIIFSPFDGGIAFTSNESYDSDIFARLYNQYNVYKKYDNDMVIFQYPFTGGNTKTYPNMGFAININSDKKNKAFKFIEYMLAEDVQSNVDYAPTIPVNKEAYNLAKNRLLNGEYLLTREDIEPYSVSDELYNQLIDIIDNSECKYNFREFLYYKCFYNPLVKRTNGISNEAIIDGVNKNLEKYNQTGKDD